MARVTPWVRPDASRTGGGEGGVGRASAPSFRFATSLESRSAAEARVPAAAAISCVLALCSWLDAATCSILRRRARYSPAIGASGQPITDSDSGSIRWVLPSD